MTHRVPRLGHPPHPYIAQHTLTADQARGGGADGTCRRHPTIQKMASPVSVAGSSLATPTRIYFFSFFLFVVVVKLLESSSVHITSSGMGNHSSIFLSLSLLLWCWGLNTEPCVCKAQLTHGARSPAPKYISDTSLVSLPCTPPLRHPKGEWGTAQRHFASIRGAS